MVMFPCSLKPLGGPHLKTLFITHRLGLCLTFWGPKEGIHTRMSFLLPFLLFPLTQDLFLPNFLARSCGRKSYLMFVCSLRAVYWFAATSEYWAHYKQVDLPATRLLLKPLVLRLKIYAYFLYESALHQFVQSDYEIFRKQGI